MSLFVTFARILTWSRTRRLRVESVGSKYTIKCHQELIFKPPKGSRTSVQKYSVTSKMPALLANAIC